MNDERLKHLIRQARGEQPPAVPEGFDARVLAAVRREQRLAPVSLWEQIGDLFPKLAVAAAIVISSSALADYLTQPKAPTFDESMAQLSEPWSDSGGDQLP